MYHENYLRGASLLASNKNDGGLRPIAVGEVLHYLTVKRLARVLNSDATRFLAPL